ncbi:MAG: ATP-binding protein [Pyrinomonadaceae bacterium]
MRAAALDLKHERVRVSEVLRSCDRIERYAAEAREQEFIVALGDDLPAVRGDAKALRRALCTIIENAIKYTPEGGHISVSAELATAEEIVVHVTDNGRGIRPEDVPHIFDKFFRGTNPKATKDPTIDGTSDDAVKPETPGVGLGLYLAERLIRALEGRIEVESSPGSGSRFSVIIPVWNDDLHEMDDVDEYGFEEGS